MLRIFFNKTLLHLHSSINYLIRNQVKTNLEIKFIRELILKGALRRLVCIDCIYVSAQKKISSVFCQDEVSKDKLCQGTCQVPSQCSAVYPLLVPSVPGCHSGGGRYEAEHSDEHCVRLCTGSAQGCCLIE